MNLKKVRRLIMIRYLLAFLSGAFFLWVFSRKFASKQLYVLKTEEEAPIDVEIIKDGDGDTPPNR
jgi:hypothetical protein